MLCASDTVRVRQIQKVMVLRPSNRMEYNCPYLEMLRGQSIDLLDHLTLETAHHAVHAGCRVGLVLVTCEDDLYHLDSCEPFLNIRTASWVGLIAQQLIAEPRVGKFIGDYLFNFLTIPVEIDHLVLSLRHAWGMAFVRDSYCKPATDLFTADSDLGMVGRTTQMQRLFAQITKVARTDASVLITGPSGTGKELAALSVHRQSGRKLAPFVTVNCGAIAPHLFQSELFGYGKPRFTGAQKRKAGRIEAAQGGTLFLDEIGDMPLDTQVSLLRVLQEKTIERGSAARLSSDVRVIAATHLDLAEAVRQGRFREDLYYRINVVCITTPKLAGRGLDIEDIAQHYFVKFSRMHNKSLRGFSKAAMEAMLRHPWPGNVRELVNRVQRAVVMAEGRYIQPEDLGFTRDAEQAPLMSLDDARATTDRAMIRCALSQARNQISHAANLLGVSRVTLYRLLEKYQIHPRVMSNPHASFFDGTQ